MFKKRLKGLLAMVLAGSIATTALPLSASAEIQSISVNSDDYSDYKNQILNGTCSVGPFESNCTQNNLWAYYADTTECGEFYLGSATGNSLGSTLSDLDNKYKSDNTTPDKHDVYLRYSHDVIFFDSAPNLYDTYDSNKKVSITDFSKDAQTDVATIAKKLGFETALQSVSSWTAYYGYTNGLGTILDRSLNGTSYTISETPKITQEIIKGLYSGNDSMESFLNYGAVFIVPEISYKTFDIPVYNGWGEDTNQKISVTNTSTGDFSSIGLKGEYVLVYDGETYYYSYSDFTTMEALWSVIQIVADEKGEFDVSKAKLVRDVQYDVFVNDNDWESFTSIDLMNEVKDNIGLNYLNERKTSGSIWQIRCCEIDPETYVHIYTNKLATGDSFDAGIKAFLNENDCDYIELWDKEELYITATDPSTLQDEDSEIKLDKDLGHYKTIDTDKQYPVKVSDLADKLTAEISPTAGMKYNKDEWELWPCYTSTGYITVESKATVADPTADIGITHYELALEQNLRDILVYFSQIAIAPAVTVTEPATGATPAATATVPENDGYSVTDVSWYDGETKLTASDSFAGGKQYTVKVTLTPDTGLQFIDDTKVTINGNAVSKTLNQDGTLTVSYTFPKTAKSELTGIKVTPPTKTKYKVGESIDVTGGKVTLIYDNNTGDNIKTEEIPLTADMLTYDNSKAGKATVTVKYDKFEDTFEVEFEKVTVDPTEPTDDPTEPTDKQPQIKGDNGKTGWDAISDAIADADDGDTIIIDMNGTTVLPEGILNDIAGRDIDIVLDIGGGFTWTINGTTVTNPTTIDMGVSTDSSIPVKVINALTGECSYITISLAHNGEFGFTAVLTVELGEKNKGLFANLYYYNDSTEKTEFVLSDIIDADGKADLTFTHASEYVIVIDDHDHGKAADDSSTTSDTTSDSDTNPSTGVPMISGVALVAGAAIMMISRKKKK